MYIAAVKEVIDRAKQDAARSGDDLNDDGPSDSIDHKDEGGSKGPRGGGRKAGSGKPTEGSTGSGGTMVMAVHEIPAKVCFFQCFNDTFYLSENSGICEPPWGYLGVPPV